MIEAWRSTTLPRFRDFTEDHYQFFSGEAMNPNICYLKLRRSGYSENVVKIGSAKRKSIGRKETSPTRMTRAVASLRDYHERQ